MSRKKREEALKLVDVVIEEITTQAQLSDSDMFKAWAIRQIERLAVVATVLESLFLPL